MKEIVKNLISLSSASMVISFRDCPLLLDMLAASPFATLNNNNACMHIYCGASFRSFGKQRIFNASLEKSKSGSSAKMMGC